MTTFQQAEWQPEYLEADGAVLAYFRAGHGKVPVVWLHGLPLDSRSWSAQRAHFDPLARNIFVDLRGYGASSRLPADCADVTCGK
jgi:non-heme chloroperoxidase